MEKMAVNKFPGLYEVRMELEGGLKGLKGFFLVAQIEIEDAEIEVDLFAGRGQVQGGLITSEGWSWMDRANRSSAT
jgi:hypothetical protein